MEKNKSHTSQKDVFRLLLAGGFFLIGAAALIFFLPRAQEYVLANNDSVVPVRVNIPAPELTLTELEGKTVSLNDYLGMTILVNNWATWCPPCKAEMPTLEAYYKEHANQNFAIIAIESGESASEVADFVQSYELTFPIWLDTQGLALDTFQNWNLPSSYVIDMDGMIRLVWNGAISRKMLETYLTPLLEK